MREANKGKQAIASSNFPGGSRGRRMTRIQPWVLLIFAFCAMQVKLVAWAQTGEAAAPGSRFTLTGGWAIQSSAKVEEPGNVISSSGFQTEGWYPTRVPSTVFAALVKNGVYPDPNFGMNLRSVPGTSYPIGANFANLPMPSDSPFRPSWWYRTKFQLPEEDQGKTLWLHFDGINYQANIWLNGHQVANSSQVQGMYRAFEFNVQVLHNQGKSTRWPSKSSRPLLMIFRSPG